jgi:hypothetical protein
MGIRRRGKIRLRRRDLTPWFRTVGESKNGSEVIWEEFDLPFQRKRRRVFDTLRWLIIVSLSAGF